MHIKISKSALAEALNNVGSVVSSKNSLQVLQNVKISVSDKVATFVCSDLDTTLISKAECEVVEAGETTIPVKTFAAAVGKVVEGVLELKVEESDIAKLTAGSTKFSFKGLPAKDFPAVGVAEGTQITMQSAALREMFRKTAFAMSNDDTSININAVLLDFSQGSGETTAVATDRRRLSLLKCSVNGSEDFNGQLSVPRKAVDVLLKKLPKDGDCKIIVSKTNVQFVTANFELYTKLVDRAFPNYRMVLPKGFSTKIVVDRVDLLGALDRTSVFIQTDSPNMFFTFGDGKLVLNSGETEFGSSRDEMPIKYDGESIELKLNPLYVRDALNVLDEDEVAIHLNDSKSPIVISKSSSDDYTYVVMPLRSQG